MYTGLDAASHQGLIIPVPGPQTVSKVAALHESLVQFRPPATAPSWSLVKRRIDSLRNVSLEVLSVFFVDFIGVLIS